MEIKKTNAGKIEIISVAGKMDALNSPDFERSVFSSIDSGVSSIIIDLSDLEYISSSGLRVFLMAAKKMQPEGKMCLCELQPQVLQIFQISGFDSIFTIYDTRDNALKHFK